jgi:magnesium chelatase accessory protein
LAPLLAEHFTIIAPDLPGHGFSTAPANGSGYALPQVADSVRALLETLDVAPRLVVGHSAGAAIGVRMALYRSDDIDTVIGLNAALLPFPGLFGAWAGIMASGLYYNPFTASAFAAQASQRGAMRSLIRGTGSDLDERGLELYQRLFSKPAHIKATLGLMAHWDLAALRRDIGLLRARLALIVADKDRAVAPQSCDSLRGVVPNLTITRLDGLGHLAHEEDPARLAQSILDIAVA